MGSSGTSLKSPRSYADVFNNPRALRTACHALRAEFDGAEYRHALRADVNGVEATPNGRFCVPEGLT